MERIGHIRETQRKDLLDAQRGPGETSPVRGKLEQRDTYDPKTETHEKQLRVREYLNTFDETILKEIFSEYFRKSGSDDTSMNWIPFEKVRIMYKTPEEEEESHSPHGSYSIYHGIELYSHKLDQSRNQALWTLIHEECHAISQDEVQSQHLSNENLEGARAKTMLRYGVALSVSTTTYDDTGTKNIELENYNNEINEGITDLLTERIYREYTKRTGSERYNPHPTQSDRTLSDTDQIVADVKFGAYERNWQNARLYIGVISAITNIPEDTVEKAVFRTYMRNDAILPHNSEIEEILSKIHPELSLTLYRLLKSKKGTDLSLESYINTIYNEPDIPNEVRKKIITALQKVKDEWGEAYKLAPFTV